MSRSRVRRIVLFMIFRVRSRIVSLRLLKGKRRCADRYIDGILIFVSIIAVISEVFCAAF